MNFMGLEAFKCKGSLLLLSCLDKTVISWKGREELYHKAMLTRKTHCVILTCCCKQQKTQIHKA